MTYTLTASVATITFSGPDVPLRYKNRRLYVTPATVTISGPTVALRLQAAGTYNLQAQPGTITISGPTVALRYSGASTAAPYRDKIAKFTWTDTSIDPQEIVGSAAVGLNSSMFSNGWRVHGDIQNVMSPEAYKTPVRSPTDAFGGWAINYGGSNGGTVGWGGFALFDWLDDPAGTGTGLGGYRIGPFVRSFWYEKTFTGLTPGLRVTFIVDINWGIDTGTGNLFIEIEGETTTRISPADTGEIWLNLVDMLNDLKYTMVTTVPANGEVTVRLGGENYTPSCNVVMNYGEAALYAIGPAVDHALLTPYPMQMVRSRRWPRNGSERWLLPSGEEDAWIYGYDGVLRATVRFIPTVTALAAPENDGWEDVDYNGTPLGGWQRFLRHISQGGAFTFYPDKNDDTTSYECVATLEEVQLVPELEDDMVRTVEIHIRTTDGRLIEGYS